ncbi:MAG: Crp/Fnr family transcriptional regulator [Aureliella sp.]
MQGTGRPTLDQSILGRHLSPEHLSRLVEVGRWLEYDAGAYLFREGEANRDVFFLLEGRVDLAMTVPGRGPCRVLTLGPDDLVAWSALVREGIMSCSAQCIDHVKLIAIGGAELEALMESNPRFGYEFMRMMATALTKRLIATRLQLLDLFAHHA